MLALHKLLLTTLTLCSAARAFGQVTVRASVTEDGTEGNGPSFAGDIDSSGRFLVFRSSATNLVSGDPSNNLDILIKDIQTQSLVRANFGASGAWPNASCTSPRISANAQYVVYQTDASNMGFGVTSTQVYRFDRASQATALVSAATGGMIPANAPSLGGVVSPQGRWVAFHSGATNLVPSHQFTFTDVYLRDMVASTTTLISKNTQGAQANENSFLSDMTVDVRYILFYSRASNLAQGDLNGVEDVFIHETQTGITTPVTVDPNFVIGNGPSTRGSVSADGTVVVFESLASNFLPGDQNGQPDIYLYHVPSKAYTRVSRAHGGGDSNGSSLRPQVSLDGTVVVFYSHASNLVPNDTNGQSDIFRYDVLSDTMVRINVNNAGLQLNGASIDPRFASDTKSIAWESLATNAVTGDGNAHRDVFFTDVSLSTTGHYCTAKINSNGCQPFVYTSGVPSLSPSGDFVVHGRDVLNQKNGIEFWGQAPDAIPFSGGTLCVAPPVIRSGLLMSGGSTVFNNCSGVFSFAFTPAYMASQGLTPGNMVYTQFWYRDPFLAPPNNTGLTNALAFTVLP